MDILWNFKDLIASHSAEVGTALAIICTYIDYRQSSDKYRTLLLVFVSLGALSTMGISMVIDSENNKVQQHIDGFAIGGKENYPLIEIDIENDTLEFYLSNVSKDYALYDIDCNFIQVSALNAGVTDGWRPISAGRFEMIRPESSIRLTTTLHESGISKKFPERRFNFFIPCKNGYFREQVVVRLINGQLHTIVRVKRYGIIMYTTPHLEKYLFPGEKKFIFQDELLGRDDSLTDPELERRKAGKAFWY
jgi:hypothetical protein